jgi:hypothetical protein
MVLAMNQEYILLFNTITDIIQELRDLENKLIAVQQKAEELYIEGTD